MSRDGRPGRGGKVSLTEQAYALIRKEIIACTLEPGLEFTELDMAERFSISKTPVREALMKLQFEGLVRAYPRRGYVIEPVKVSDINEIFDMRLIVEAGAVQFAVERATNEDIARLKEIALSQDDESYHEQPDRSNSINNLFHENIALASRNARLHRSVMQMLGELERFFYIEARSTMAYPERHASHRDIVAAMEARNVGTARAAIVDHIEGTRNVLLASIIDGRRKSSGWVL